MSISNHKQFKTVTKLSIFSCVFILAACGGSNTKPPQEETSNAPVFTSGTTISVDENTTATGYTATASDADGDTVSFSLSGGVDQSTFSIDSASGVLAFLSAPDFENPTDSDTNNTYVVEITATDGDNSVTQSITVTVTDVDETTSIGGQAVLGPISEGDYAIFDITDFNTPVATGVTSGGTDINEIGRMNPATSLFDITHAYLIIVTGGADVDVDDNLVLDNTPSPLNNPIHAIVSGEQLAGGGAWQVTVLTEVAYQQVKFLLENGSSAATILAALDDIAKQLVSADLNGDGKIDTTDLNLWHPTVYASKSILPLSERVNLNLQLLNGSPITLADINISNEISSHPFPSFGGREGTDIAVLNDIAYITMANNCYLIQVDISDITNPQTVGEYGVPTCEDELKGLMIHEGNLYISHQNGSVAIYDATTPIDDASRKGLFYNDPNADDRSIDIAGVSYSIKPLINHQTSIVGDYAYVRTKISNSDLFGGDDIGLMVLNVSDPTTFNPVAIFKPESDEGEIECQDISAQGNRAYLYCNDQLITLNIEQPETPQILSSQALPIDNQMYVMPKVRVSDDGLYLYIASFPKFYIIDLVDNSIASEVAIVNTYSDYPNIELGLDNGFIYFASAAAVEIIDVNDPTAVKHIALIKRADNVDISSVYPYGDVLLTTGGTSSNPLFVALNKVPQPTLVGVTGSISGKFSEVELSGKYTSSSNYIYTAMSLDGGNYDTFTIVEISNPEVPTIIGSLTLPPYTNASTGESSLSSIFSIQAWDSLVFVSTNGGIFTIDISDPTNPTQVAYKDLVARNQGGSRLALNAQDGGVTLYYSYVSLDNHKSHIVVSDAFTGNIIDGNSIFTDTSVTSFAAKTVETGVDRLFYSSGTLTSWMVDTQSTGSQLSQATTVSSGGADFDLHGDDVFIINDSAFTIVDASNSSTEGNLIGQTSIAGQGLKLKVDASNAYIVSGQGGLNIIDITDSSTPTLASIIHTSASANTVSINDSYVVFSEAGKALHIVKKPVRAVP